MQYKLAHKYVEHAPDGLDNEELAQFVEICVTMRNWLLGGLAAGNDAMSVRSIVYAANELDSIPRAELIEAVANAVGASEAEAGLISMRINDAYHRAYGVAA